MAARYVRIGQHPDYRDEIRGTLAEILASTANPGTYAAPEDVTGTYLEMGSDGLWTGASVGYLTKAQADAILAAQGVKATLKVGVPAQVDGVQYTWRGAAAGGWGKPVTARRISGPVRVAYFGPSTADNYVGVCDMLSAYSAYPGSGFTTYNVITPGKMEASAIAGRLLVGCAGVSGETIAQSYARFLATYSTSRKAPTDALNTKPHVIVYKSCAINTIQTYVATASDAEIATQVAVEVEIVKHFVRNGCMVVFSGPLGYSAAVSAGLLAIRRDAVVRYLAAYKSALSSMENVQYVDAVGLTCNTDGSFISSAISSDGIHLTDAGGRIFCANAESNAISNMIVGTPFYGVSVFDSAKAVGNNDGTLAITHSGGNASSGASYTAEECSFNLTTAAGGTTTAAFLSAGLTASFMASTPYAIVYDIEIQDSQGNVRAYDDGIKILFRCLFRNASSADAFFDQTPVYVAGKFVVPVVVPSVAPTLVQIFAQFQTSRVESLKVKVRPIGVYRADLALIQ